MLHQGSGRRRVSKQLRVAVRLVFTVVIAVLPAFDSTWRTKRPDGDGGGHGAEGGGGGGHGEGLAEEHGGEGEHGGGGDSGFLHGGREFVAVECVLLLLLLVADFAMRRHLDDGEERVANANQLLHAVTSHMPGESRRGHHHHHEDGGGRIQENGGGSKKDALEEGLLANEQ